MFNLGDRHDPEEGTTEKSTLSILRKRNDLEIRTLGENGEKILKILRSSKKVLFRLLFWFLLLEVNGVKVRRM